MADLTLNTNSRSFSGWKSIRIGLGMDQCANSFEIAVSELWPDQTVARRILPGEPCEVLLGDETVITGYVDELSIQHSGDEHGVRVTGRDKTADLVDCSVTGKTGQWRGQRIEQIAAQLAEPFKVAVRADVDTGKPLASFALQEGETVFEALDRAARMRALLLVSDGQGRLLITRAGKNRVATPLVLGQNILAGDLRFDFRDRYSNYLVKGQSAGPFFEEADAAATARAAKQAAQASAQAFDGRIGRFRPLVLTAECQDIAATLQQRVEWEANVRAARSIDVQITVQGWSHDAGLWRPNSLVNVLDPWLGIEGELLIRAVEFSLDDGGTKTRLSLTDPAAFNILRSKEQGVDAFKRFWDQKSGAAR